MKDFLKLAHRGVLALVCLAHTLAADPAAGPDLRPLFAPSRANDSKRLATADDIVKLRQIVVLRVAPDLRRYALLVRQPDPVTDAYVSAWFIGEVDGGAPRYAGDGGDTSLSVLPDGAMPGDLAAPDARWSPDSRWLVYPVKRGEEIQLWRASADSAQTEQLTHNEADPREFEWAADGQKLYFNTASPREARLARRRQLERTGFNYDGDIFSYLDLMKPQLREVPEPPQKLWVLALADRSERPATAGEQEEFATLKTQRLSGSAAAQRRSANSAVVRHANGGTAWLEGMGEFSLEYRVKASFKPDRADAIACPGELGSGLLDRFWWSDDGEHVRFTRLDLANAPGYRILDWAPKTGALTELFHFADDFLRDCSPVPGDKLIGIRESMGTPVHLASLDLRTRTVSVLADPNPEFQGIRLGRALRLEWDTPALPWNEPGGELAGSYPRRAVGYILLPPDFDPTKRYPAFIEPYALYGFNSSVGQEHPLQAYAAAGIVVLNLSFPVPMAAIAKYGPDGMLLLYSSALGFPHISMRMESTVNGLKAATDMGFIDSKRVGIGGVSNGTFVPLRLMQKYDLIAAASISGGGWGPEEYYFPTKKGRANFRGKDWRPKPAGAGAEYWRQLDLAEHVETLEAPILMHHSLGETHTAVRLMRHMADANLPYDAYIFTNETHVKWQPAHRQAIMNRNLDWFRFWLKDEEDPAPEKAGQYARWHELRKMHDARSQPPHQPPSDRPAAPAGKPPPSVK